MPSRASVVALLVTTSLLCPQLARAQQPPSQPLPPQFSAPPASAPPPPTQGAPAEPQAGPPPHALPALPPGTPVPRYPQTPYYMPGRIEVDAEGGTLERHLLGSSDDDEEWKATCVSPCVAFADPRFEYRIGGAGRRSSDEFRVNPAQTTLVRGKTGSRSQTGWGIALLSAGGTVASVGLLLALASSGPPRNDSSDNSRLRFFALTFTLGGLAAGTAGIFMIINNRTKVDVTRDPGSAPSLSLRLTPSLSLTPQGLVF